MKKIIAAAMSVLLGAFGFTITDKKVEERLSNLEASVSSMQEEISSLHETKPVTIPETTTTNSESSTTNPTITIGTEILPYYGSYQSKYMLRCYSDGRITYVPTHSSDSYFPVSTTTSSQLTYTDILLYLTEVEANVTVSENYTEPHSYYDKDYSIVHSYKDKQNNEVAFKFKGNTSPELSGKLVNFDLQFWYDYDHDIVPSSVMITTDNSIDSDGNFEYTVIYKFSESISGFFPDDTIDNGCMKYDITQVTVK